MSKKEEKKKVVKARYNKWDVREACMQNDIELLQNCIDKKAPLDDLDFDDEIGYIEGQIYWRPLLHAARYDHEKCAQMLLDAASTKGDMKAVQILLKHMKDPSHIKDLDNDGWTPLIHAAAVGFTEGVELLVTKYKCDLHQVEYGGWNALGLAVANNKLQTVKRILELAGDRAKELVNKMANDNWGVVYVAAQRGFAPVLQVLIDYGADVGLHAKVNVETDEGDIPLWTAQFKHRQECIDILLPLTHPDYLE